MRVACINGGREGGWQEDEFEILEEPTTRIY